ncbi:DinB family protein [Arthrobacter sp. A5]|uniref:DinB family protein n=1 Tax=Arthrobacter sp. A5 TaxID=576926 RepID=UPI003DA7F969
MEPTAEDLRTVIDDLMGRFSGIPDDNWQLNAHELDWSCRETAAHILDDFGFYAMQLSGTKPPQESYIELQDPPPWRDGGPQLLFYPDAGTGTPGIVSCLDAVGGLLVAVVAAAPADRRGYHPAGLSDASGFAAMGIVEAVLHCHDILTAQGVDYRPDDAITDRVLARLFPDVRRTSDCWQDLLRSSGRTAETRGQHWRWDSAVRTGR